MMIKEKKFASKRGVFIIVFIFLLIGLSLIPLFLAKDTISKIAFCSIFIIGAIPFIWIYYGTNYKITNDFLFYKSAFIKGKVDIKTIKQLNVGETMLVGIKPATSGKGIIIKFGKDEEIYVSPESNEEFVNELVLINKNIVVKHSQF